MNKKNEPKEKRKSKKEKELEKIIQDSDEFIRDDLNSIIQSEYDIYAVD